MASFKLLVLVATFVAVAAASPRARRVIEGKVIPIEEAPWKVQVEYIDRNGKFDNDRHCGAALISPTQALTAGHCVGIGKAIPDNIAFANTGKFMRIRAGTWNKMEGGQVIAVKSVNVHPDYVKGKGQYDVAILNLAEPVQLNDKARPIPLGKDKAKPASVLHSAGWGLTSKAGQPDNFHEGLKSADITVVNEKDCASLRWACYREKDAPINCVLPKTGYNAAGDSGGAIWNDKNELVGVHMASIGHEVNGVEQLVSMSIDVTSKKIRCFLADHVEGVSCKFMGIF